MACFPREFDPGLFLASLDGIEFYTLTNGSVTKTDISDPNGFVRSISFNADGWMSSETLAQGKTYAQTFTYNRQAGTGLLNNVIDPLNRKTSFTYDPKGNVKSITRLDGKPGALTTSFSYEPAFNQLASVTDPLTLKGSESTIRGSRSRR